MRPVDSFLRSVRDAFRPAEETSDWAWVALAACILSAVAWLLVARLRRRQAEQGAFARYLADRHVSRTQAQLITHLAERAGVTPRAVATQIEVFERATALEFQGHPPPTPAGEAPVFAQVAALRAALGFQERAGNFAVHTTRELGPGQPVKVAGMPATIVEVNEAFLAAAAPAEVRFPVGPPGSMLRMTFVHGHEARYETRCALLARETGSGTQKLILRHDEQPTRIQLRKAVRVTVRGPVHLHPLALGGVRPASREGATDPEGHRDSTGAPAQQGVASSVGAVGAGADFTDQKVGNGSLVDISVGGAAVDATSPVPVGSLVHLSFDLDGSSYEDLLALVLACDPLPRALHHLRLEFRKLSQADENRLAASVARYSAKPFTAEGE